jgi:hypothetical protein
MFMTSSLPATKLSQLLQKNQLDSFDLVISTDNKPLWHKTQSLFGFTKSENNDLMANQTNKVLQDGSASNVVKYY